MSFATEMLYPSTIQIFVTYNIYKWKITIPSQTHMKITTTIHLRDGVGVGDGVGSATERKRYLSKPLFT